MDTQNRRGRTIRIEVDQDGHRVGIVLAPHGLDGTDNTYDEEGGDSAEVIDGDGMTVNDKVKWLNEELDHLMATPLDPIRGIQSS